MRLLHIIALSAGVLLAACAKKDDPAFQGWVEADLIFVAQTERGQEMMTAAAFAKKYKWKNVASLVKLTAN